jgi:amino acid transporter
MAFALQVIASAGLYDPTSEKAPSRGPVIGIAISALTGVILLHTLSRRIGIWVNNSFAVIKVALLLTIVSHRSVTSSMLHAKCLKQICLGIAKSAGAFGGSGGVVHRNFTQDVWTRPQTHVSSWTDSLLLCLYSLSGFKQPFYILAETRGPRKTFPKYVVLAVLITGVLFLLVNISYLLVVDKRDIIKPNGMPTGANMAALFFDKL